jgi:hypothetical protein
MTYGLVIIGIIALIWVFKNMKKLMQSLFAKNPAKGQD